MGFAPLESGIAVLVAAQAGENADLFGVSIHSAVVANCGRKTAVRNRTSFDLGTDLVAVPEVVRRKVPMGLPQ